MSKTPDSLPNLDRLHLLHLGYEDFRRPGSGGGSMRTHEIDRRLARTHEVTVLVAKYAGSRDRIEDGVRYVHIGLPLGYFPSLLAYFAWLPLALRRYKADLVIEEFGAPFSSIAVPLLTKRPVVGMVQWMFAREKARQYHLPFHWVEKVGVRSHREMITVSSALREDVLRVNSRAIVHVVWDGVDEAAWETDGAEGRHLLFLGRLEVAQKGIDRLIEAFSLIAPHTDSDLLIAGDGPDRERVKTMVRERGLDGRVRFVGRVSGRAKFDLLASARLLLMPSRYETFGIVAAEGLACQTPVVAFDLPCLREVIPAEAGILVAQGDVAAFATAVLDLLADGDRRCRMGAAGRAFSRRFDWEQLANDQEVILRDVVGSHPQGFSMRARLRWLALGRQDPSSDVVQPPGRSDRGRP
jgi:glycosyltransferase involved in cell wall biosynthesis